MRRNGRRNRRLIALGMVIMALVLLAGCRKPNAPAGPTPTSWLGNPAAGNPAAGNSAAAGTPVAAGAPTTAASVDAASRPAAATAYALATQRAAVSPVPSATASPTVRPTRPEEALFSAILPVSDESGQGRDPSALAILGDTLYVACRSTANVAVIRNNRVVAYLPVGSEPSALVADPARQRVIVLTSGDGSLAIIEKDKIVASWQLDQAITHMALVGGELWVSGATGTTLFALSAENGQALGQVAMEANQFVNRLMPAPDGATLYALADDRLYAVDVAGRSIATQVEIESAYDLTISPDGQRLYVLRYDAPTSETVIQVLNPRDLAARQKVAVPSDVSVVLASPTDGRLIALSGGGGLALAFDGATLKPLGQAVVGWRPQYATFDAAGRVLYVANRPAQNITAVDAATLQVRAVIPLAPVLTGLAVDPISARVYVAAASRARVLVFDPAGQPVGTWEAGLYPAGVQAVSGAGLVAVLDQPAALVRLLDQTGASVKTHATGANPQGLMVDEFEQRVYAGDLELSLGDNTTRTFKATTYTNLDTPPVQTVLDTRRGIVYGIVSNGVPGSNGGLIVRRLDEPADQATIAWGRQSMIAALYDEEFDRFYSLWQRMGSNGLLISDGETGRPLYDIPFDRPATALALDPGKRHLWVTLSGEYASDGASRLLCYDTASVTQWAALPLPAPVDALAVDVRNARLYLASSAMGNVYALDEAVAGLSSQHVAIPSVTPAATVETTPMPTATRTPAPPSAALEPTAAPTCVGTVHADFRAAWAAAGGDEGIGCAYLDASEGDWAIQPFEGGMMLWRGGVSYIYVLGTDGSLRQMDDLWRDGMPAQSCELAVPADRQLPVRGFGAIWCADADIRVKLGWATAKEQGFRPLYQVLWRGELVRLPDGRILALYNDGHWSEAGR